MTIKTKKFRIVESAIGGIIQVTIDTEKKFIRIEALDWNTEKPVSGVKRAEIAYQEFGAKNGIDEYLNELTSFYYTEKVMKWILTHILPN